VHYVYQNVWRFDLEFGGAPKVGDRNPHGPPVSYRTCKHRKLAANWPNTLELKTEGWVSG